MCSPVVKKGLLPEVAGLDGGYGLTERVSRYDVHHLSAASRQSAASSKSFKEVALVHEPLVVIEQPFAFGNIDSDFAVGSFATFPVTV